jgi:putative methylase
VRRFSADYLETTRRGMWADSRAALSDLQLDECESILDVGCGTGELTRVLREETDGTVVGLDADTDLLSAAGDPTVCGDATRLPLAVPDPVTVVMNPPFGARDGNRNADRGFLATASRVATVSYSVHNAGSEEFVESFAADNGGEVTHAFAADFAIDAQFDHHEEASREVDAEVYRIEWA